MEDKILSVLRLERLAFEDIQYYRSTEKPLNNVEYEMNFSRNVGFSEDEKNFAVKLSINLWSKQPNLFSLKMTLVGYFSCECEDETTRETLIKYNTVAILFPYIRSEVSLLTAQPDVAPIVLPPINIVAMFEAVDNPNAESQKN